MPYHPESLTDPSQRKTSASTTTQPPWDPIKGLSNVHMEIIRQHVQGTAVSRIKYALKRYDRDLSGTHIRRIIDSPSGRRYASFYSAQIHGGVVGLTGAMAEHLPGAAFVETEIMYDPFAGERHRLNAAQDVMDRFGIPKVSRQEQDGKLPQTVIINLLPSQLAQFAAPPPVIEAECVVLDLPSTQTD